MADQGILRVTAIIPTFRSEHVILRALRSVLEQTHQPIEIIVVDDASDDLTVQIVRQFAADFPRIHLVVNNQNQGPGRSRNTAWEQSTTEFIAFLDADDTWHPTKIASQLEWFSSHPDAVICGTEHTVARQLKHESGRVSDSVFTLRDLLRRNRFTTPSVMLRRDMSLRFDSVLRLSEDYLLWMKIASTYGCIYRLNQPLTILHKPIYGASGLSSKIFPMFFGELRAIRILGREGRIGYWLYLKSICWSSIKLLRRFPISIFRYLTWRRNNV